ncbi:MAG: XRE family transcriptional regulator [Xanthobacteraceae bacterium]|nr:MAG: XRE family transcriptional regulator [Xanthobacteraceae bacterium]
MAELGKRKRKLFAGATIRRLRESNRLTQQTVAQRLGISASYLNQIESNQRPLTAPVLVELARVFRVDVAALSEDSGERLIGNLQEALSDPLVGGAAVGAQEIKVCVQQTPNIAKTIVRLHDAHRQLAERYQAIDDALLASEAGPQESNQFPYDEVREFFHRINNYVDPLDRAAEALAEREGLSAGKRLTRLVDYLRRQHGIAVVFAHDTGPGLMRHFDRDSATLRVNGLMEPATQAFVLAHQIALIEQREEIEALVARAEFRSTEAPAVCTLALANYFAGALLLPYERLLAAAREVRHDVELLCHRFEASFEQVCHRLSTLQRSGREGIPFYFLRVDRAGNITKRHSATRLQFARYGGACPLWNIHEAFEAPDRMLVQVAEMPDKTRYLSIARGITKSGGSYRAPLRRYAIGFGCETAYAEELVYADGLDLRSAGAATMIGVSCRLCERADCHQRAVPPVGRAIAVDLTSRGQVPYRVL